MEEILSKRKKHLSHSPSKIKEILVEISNIQLENEKLTHKLEENESKICELAKEVTALNDELEIEKQNLECKVSELKEHSYVLKDLKKDKEIQESSLADIEAEYRQKQKTKPSIKDLQLLERGKRKLQLYKEFTHIRWDYSAPGSVIEGFITNKTDYLEKIMFKNVTDYKSVTDSLWKSIHKFVNSTAKDDCKENKPSNK